MSEGKRGPGNLECQKAAAKKLKLGPKEGMGNQSESSQRYFNDFKRAWPLYFLHFYLFYIDVAFGVVVIIVVTIKFLFCF
jgi:hypothetical protein